MTAPDRLRAADLRPLWTELHRRFSTGAAVTRVTVRNLDEGQRAALADLLGMDRYPGSTVTVAVERLDKIFIELTGSDTRAITESLLGPIGDQARERRERQRERSALWEWLASHPVVRGEPELGRWGDDVRRQGLVMGSVPATRSLLERVLKVLAALPSDGRPLQAFATDLFGDSHALDDGGRLSGLVLRAQAIRYGIEPPVDASERRGLWERSGVACDTLSTTALVAGLRPGGDDVLARTLRMWSDVGQATVVTLEQLRGSPALRLDSPEALDSPEVWVTENPTILALAIGRFGAGCPPLVCSSGWPNSAVIRLLRALGESGAVLRYHGDFDGEGLRIAAHVMAKTGAVPWRMSSADYLAAVDSAEDGDLPEPGRVGESPWDPKLAVAIAERGVAVLEEKFAEVLLGDISRAITTCT
ncbi:TIGR02679 family protein [Actinomadura meyerae]|uniref:TIGR02679 family protein n=1 Tax=Actinomadura meyerae TaxID=240840 RepID=A0A239HS72_9ACTN|nr:TIGR02679 family protein [Actinomadura meyerae]SNS84081.1 TIGR02679 family protein [Actinomadura meyerae]